MPPITMITPPMTYPITSPVRSVPSPMSQPKKNGPIAPKTWAMAKKTAIASARISMGHVSLTVR